MTLPFALTGASGSPYSVEFTSGLSGDLFRGDSTRDHDGAHSFSHHSLRMSARLLCPHLNVLISNFLWQRRPQKNKKAPLPTPHMRIGAKGTYFRGTTQVRHMPCSTQPHGYADIERTDTLNARSRSPLLGSEGWLRGDFAKRMRWVPSLPPLSVRIAFTTFSSSSLTI